jgi:starvation-inducible DNA-binding protein
MKTPNLSTTEADREQIADALSQLLADSYTLYLKTHNFHWNVTGPQFGELHTMFETQYTDLATAVDEIAERIRALGHLAPGSYSAFSARTTIPEASEGKTAAMDMVAALSQDHETLAKSAAAAIAVAEAAGDEPSAGLATDRQEIHEKTAWMLRSYLE